MSGQITQIQTEIPFTYHYTADSEELKKRVIRHLIQNGVPSDYLDDSVDLGYQTAKVGKLRWEQGENFTIFVWRGYIEEEKAEKELPSRIEVFIDNYEIFRTSQSPKKLAFKKLIEKGLPPEFLNLRSLVVKEESPVNTGFLQITEEFDEDRFKVVWRNIERPAYANEFEKLIEEKYGNSDNNNRGSDNLNKLEITITPKKKNLRFIDF